MKRENRSQQYKRFFVPQDLAPQLLEVVRDHCGHSENHYYKCLYIIHYLCYYRCKYPRKYKFLGAPVNFNIMGSLVGRKEKAALFEQLESWGLIEQRANYCPGLHSKMYGLSASLEAQPLTITTVFLHQASVVHKLFQADGRELREDKFIKQQHNIFLEHLTLSEEGLQFICRKYPCPHMQAIVEAYGKDTSIDEALAQVKVLPEDIILFTFLTRDYFIPTRPVKDSRLYTSLTCLKREYRPFLLLDGHPLLLTDLVNSQILFSVPLIEQRLPQGKPDFHLYKSLAEEGRMYEALAQQAGISLTLENRTAFKERFFKEIFFSRVTPHRRAVKSAFQTLFPSVLDTINTIKAPAYNQFAIQLQAMEASVMISVLKDLVKKNILALSIHDSIVVNREAHLELAETMIAAALQKKYNLKAKFKR